jgi:hypothetical protein
VTTRSNKVAWRLIHSGRPFRRAQVRSLYERQLPQNHAPKPASPLAAHFQPLTPSAFGDHFWADSGLSGPGGCKAC